MEDLPPVMINGTGHPYGPVLLHFFYAANSAPSGIPKDTDKEDEDGVYDWYTFPHALKVLCDEPSRLALHTAAMALNVAAAGNKVPIKWNRFEGGVFGHEVRRECRKGKQNLSTIWLLW